MRRMRHKGVVEKVADRPAPTKLTVGPASALGKSYASSVWLVQFEGPGYTDYDHCFTRDDVDACVHHFEYAYPGITVKWLAK